MIRSASTRRGGALIRMLGPAACLLVIVLLARGIIDWLDSDNRPPYKAICTSNMKHLGSGLRMYIMDYDDKPPPAGKWQDASFPYVKDLTVYVCPSRKDVKPGYAFNQRLDGIVAGKVAKPEQTPMLFESNRGQRNGADQLLSFVTPHRDHVGNVCFLDGHVKSFSIHPTADAGLKDSKR